MGTVELETADDLSAAVESWEGTRFDVTASRGKPTNKEVSNLIDILSSTGDRH